MSSDSGDSFNIPVLCWLAIAILAVLALGRVAKGSEGEDCHAPEYFGICDPFVPGTVIRVTDYEPFIVISPWPDSPAERAGICPDDEIVAINGVSAIENTVQRMLRELVSELPMSVVLQVRRGEREMELSVPRVRESTLAYLSRQKFLRNRLVPLEQTLEGLHQLEEFVRRELAQSGLKEVGTVLCPMDTPEDRAMEFSKFLREIVFTPRLPGGPAKLRELTTPMARDPDGYAPGFRALMLKKPDEVRVYGVLPDSPAHRAGLWVGDEVLEINAHPIPASSEELENLLFEPNKFRSVSIKVRRNSSVRTLKFNTQIAQEFAHPERAKILPEGTPSKQDHFLGLHLRYSHKLQEAVVERVAYPSPAFEEGVHVGDLILAMNGVPIDQLEPQRIEALLRPSSAPKSTLRVLRAGHKLSFQLIPIKRGEALATIGWKWTKHGPTPEHCPGQ